MPERSRKFRYLVLFGLFVALIALCSLHPEDYFVSFDEVQRVKSPDQKYDVVVAEENGGATTSFNYLVYILPSGGLLQRHHAWGTEPQMIQIGSLYGAIRNEQAYGLNVHWSNSNTVVLECLKADRVNVPTKARLQGKDFSIVYNSQTLDPLAPPGGMDYNNNRQKGHL
jgi:hypothetical protein